MSEQTAAKHIAALRAAMRQHQVAACIVPTADPHLSEYLPAHWKAREWLSGFTGSAGTLIATADFAGLWTDSRYFSQAERQLAGAGVELMRLVVPDPFEWLDWLAAHLGRGQVAACAADMLSRAQERRIKDRLAAEGAQLIEEDLPALIWSTRPALPTAKVFEHPLQYAIRTRAEKLAATRAVMRQANATHHLVSALDEIAWTLNLRGSDVQYNPVFLSHLLLSEQGATLCVDESKLGSVLPAQLHADGVQLAAYTGIGAALNGLPKDARLLFDPAHVCAAVAHCIPGHVHPIELAGPITAAKAVKSAAELAEVRAVMQRDGVALVRAAHWLEAALARGDALTELDVDAKLRELRTAQPGFVSESFATIAGYEANAALPHYQATPESHARLLPRGMLLIDSGGQYLGGTTDITRMWALGETTSEERHDVTLVLKGVIALSRARFPRGASGQQLDALARAPIWAQGLDYGHGTGHGVGYFLNVHEGPQSIRPPRSGSHLVALEAGMITSVEPGIYKPGRHGVRIENLVATVPAGAGEFGEFLAFETLTLCPIDTRLLDLALLDASEIVWLDRYHATVRERLGPLLDNPDERAWLRARCAPQSAQSAA
ncbi:MAG: aminopeptidase P family protein [Gammaproteobacteria bacterium]